MRGLLITYILFVGAAFGATDRCANRLALASLPKISLHTPVGGFSKKELLARSAAIPWNDYYQQAVAVDYNYWWVGQCDYFYWDAFVAQEVLNLKDLDAFARELASKLVNQTHFRMGPLKVKFVETGILAIVTDSARYSSAIFHSWSSKSISGSVIKKHWERLLSRATRNGDTIRRILLLHTHPGSGTPLSVADRNARESHFGQWAQLVEFYALPVDSSEGLLFRLVSR